MVLEREVSILQHIEIPEAHIKLRGDGIVHVHFKKNAVLDVELQLRMRMIYDEMTAGEKLKFIFSADEGFILTKEARENAPKIQKLSPILYYALIANNLAYRIVANFYIKVIKPNGNYKLFSTFEAAVKWLNSLPDEPPQNKV